MEDILVLVITEGQPIFIGKCGKIGNILGVLKKNIFFSGWNTMETTKWITNVDYKSVPLE